MRNKMCIYQFNIYNLLTKTCIKQVNIQSFHNLHIHYFFKTIYLILEKLNPCQNIQISDFFNFNRINAYKVFKNK